MKELLVFLLVPSLSTVLAANQKSEKLKVCGLSGSINERINDCSFQSGNFVLVTRTEELKEVYQDTKTGLLWGDRLIGTMAQWDAMVSCHPYLPEVGRIHELQWRLPTLADFEEGRKNGINSVLPNMKGWLWSDTVTEDGIYAAMYSPQLIFFFERHGKVLGANNGNSIVGARCVGE